MVFSTLRDYSLLHIKPQPGQLLRWSPQLVTTLTATFALPPYAYIQSPPGFPASFQQPERWIGRRRASRPQSSPNSNSGRGKAMQKLRKHPNAKTAAREDPEFHRSHVAVTGVVNHEISIKFEGAICRSDHPRH